MGWDDWIALCCDAILYDWLGWDGIRLGWDRMAMAMAFDAMRWRLMRCDAMRYVALRCHGNGCDFNWKGWDGFGMDQLGFGFGFGWD